MNMSGGIKGASAAGGALAVTGGTLPFTGFGFTVFGITFGLNWLIGMAMACIVAGVVLLRVSTRHARRSSY